MLLGFAFSAAALGERCASFTFSALREVVARHKYSATTTVKEQRPRSDRQSWGGEIWGPNELDSLEEGSLSNYLFNCSLLASIDRLSSVDLVAVLFWYIQGISFESWALTVSLGHIDRSVESSWGSSETLLLHRSYTLLDLSTTDECLSTKWMVCWGAM